MRRADYHARHQHTFTCTATACFADSEASLRRTALARMKYFIDATNSTATALTHITKLTMRIASTTPLAKSSLNCPTAKNVPDCKTTTDMTKKVVSSML